MESSIKDTFVNCEIHPSETIRKICLDTFCEKSLFCIECILASIEDVSQTHKQLVSLEEFVNKATKLYENNMKIAENRKEIPSHLKDVFSLEGDQLENLSKHIACQKSRVDSLTDGLIARFTALCHNKRAEIHDLLNKELVTFKYNYQYYDKLLKRHFKVGESENLFQSKQELIDKILKFQSSAAFFNFVKDIKSDFLDAGDNDEIKILKKLESCVNVLTSELPKALPIVINPDLPIDIDYDSIMKDSVDNIFKSIFIYDNRVPDLSVTKALTLPNSRIIKKVSEMALLRKWLGKPANFKLIYSGHKDGYTPKAFHEKCDGKSNTLTVMLSNLNKIFGAFMDSAWHSTGEYLISDKAWLYSLSCQKKYEIKPGCSQNAGAGVAQYGPAFGSASQDCYVYGDFRTQIGHCNPTSYNWSGGDQLAGAHEFTLKEIEVYQVTFSSE
jgi:hypothetical protein